MARRNFPEDERFKFLYDDWRTKPMSSWNIQRLREMEPKVEKVKHVKATVNLINKDDSVMSIAFHTLRVLSKYSPEHHQVLITYLEWRRGSEDSKRKLMNFLLDDYQPVWQVRLVQRSVELVEVKFTFPGMEWLVFG